MKKNTLYTTLLFFLVSFAIAQTDTTKKEDDFNADEYAATEKIKAFCSPKVLDVSPQKLISIGYDFQTTNQLTAANVGNFAQETSNIRYNHGLRVNVLYPIISKNSLIVNVAANYWEQNYVFENKEKLNNPLHKSLQNGLKNIGLGFTIYKPLNEKHFLIFQGGTNLNGDYSFSNFQSLDYLRYNAAAIFGWKRHERLQIGVGATRTYLGGALNYVPILMYNYTFRDRKWGIEGLFPARVNLRRTINQKSLVMFGYELEGATYRLNNVNEVFPNSMQDIELRRSEMRIRFTYERQLKNFVWLSIQAGYRYNWLFNTDQNGDFFRSLFENKPFLMENSLTNPLYFNISLNLVSP
jgi:hypothetical protein